MSTATEDSEEATKADENTQNTENGKQETEEASDASRTAVEKEYEAGNEATTIQVGADASENAAAEEAPAAETNEDESKPVSEAIQEMVQSPAVSPGDSAKSTMDENTPTSGAAPTEPILARDLMRKDVVWAGPEESVQQTLANMEHHRIDHIMIGSDGVLEGIVSKSDLKGAISPYLRPEFARWRRPLDDATLQIRIKWLMRKPVHTVAPETPLAVVMENICRSGKCALPVTDEQNKVHGLITVFDIFRALLTNGSGINIESEALPTV
ncbi:MAG: CBS domain-containing protein [Planctomycetota bacterium]|jgi:CBS domain-containing protein